MRQGKNGAETTITLRDYRSTVLYGVALWNEGLEAVRDALRQPVFTLSLGRKSCPLSAPLKPEIFPAPDAATALANIRLPPWLAGAQATLIATEEELPGGRVEFRQDTPTDRIAWHFAPRAVRMLPCDIKPPVAGRAA